MRFASERSYTRGYMSHKMPTHATTCRHAQTRNVPTQAAIPKGRKMCMATYAQTRKKCARAISGERKESSERERERDRECKNMTTCQNSRCANTHADMRRLLTSVLVTDRNATSICNNGLTSIGLFCLCSPLTKGPKA